MLNLFEINKPNREIRYIVYRGWLPEDKFEHICDINCFEQATHEYGYPIDQIVEVYSKTDALYYSQ